MARKKAESPDALLARLRRALDQRDPEHQVLSLPASDLERAMAYIAELQRQVRAARVELASVSDLGLRSAVQYVGARRRAAAMEANSEQETRRAEVAEDASAEAFVLLFAVMEQHALGPSHAALARDIATFLKKHWTGGEAED